MSKIFGIGVAKTGTTTLWKALEILGYKSVHVECNVMIVDTLNDKKEFSIDKNVIESNDAIIGTPLSPCYKKLSAMYGDSIFILTVRKTDTWLKSCSIAFTKDLPMDQNHHKLHRWLYDSIRYDKNKFMSGYNNFVSKALNFFKTNYSGRLLVFNVSEGWEPLCRFVKKDIPPITFPHENKKNYPRFGMKNHEPHEWLGGPTSKIY